MRKFFLLLFFLILLLVNVSRADTNSVTIRFIITGAPEVPSGGGGLFFPELKAGVVYTIVFHNYSFFNNTLNVSYSLQDADGNRLLFFPHNYSFAPETTYSVLSFSEKNGNYTVLINASFLKGVDYSFNVSYGNVAGVLNFRSKGIFLESFISEAVFGVKDLLPLSASMLLVFLLALFTPLGRKKDVDLTKSITNKLNNIIIDKVIVTFFLLSLILLSFFLIIKGDISENIFGIKDLLPLLSIFVIIFLFSLIIRKKEIDLSDIEWAGLPAVEIIVIIFFIFILGIAFVVNQRLFL